MNVSYLFPFSGLLKHQHVISSPIFYLPETSHCIEGQNRGKSLIFTNPRQMALKNVWVVTQNLKW